MELLEGAMWIIGQLLEICLGFIALCLGFMALCLIVILFGWLFDLIAKHYKLFLCALCVFVLCGFGYGYYNYIEQKKMENAEQLKEIQKQLHEQCFANCHIENYYLDLFTLQDFHNNVIWSDSTNNGNEKVYKTYLYPQDICMWFRPKIEIKSTFNKIYYYSYEIDMFYYIDMCDGYLEENGFMKIEEDVTENEYVEPQTIEQELEALENDRKALENEMKELEENPRKVLKEIEEKARRDEDKKCNHIYKKDNITIKIKLFHVNEDCTRPRCKIEVYNNEMEDLINII